MEDAIVVRPASAQDAGVIFSFVAGLIEDHLPGQAPWTSAERIREDGFGPDPLFEVLIAERDAKPVGFVSFFRGYTGWRGKPMGIVHALYVRPEERRTGAARELMANVARIALERGFRRRGPLGHPLLRGDRPARSPACICAWRVTPSNGSPPAHRAGSGHCRGPA